MLRVLDERVHVAKGLSFSFQRVGTVSGVASARISNLGALPVHKVLDYADSFPAVWRKPEAVFVPLLTSENIWLGFASVQGRPHAVQVAVAGTNAVTGLVWVPYLQNGPQDYLVVPLQMRWEGIQFADRFEPFSSAALRNRDGTEKNWMLIAYNCRYEYPEPARPSAHTAHAEPLNESPSPIASQQQTTLVPDPYGLQFWQQPAQDTVYIHAVTSRRYEEITGVAAPPTRSPSDVYGGQRLP